MRLELTHFGPKSMTSQPTSRETSRERLKCRRVESRQKLNDSGGSHDVSGVLSRFLLIPRVLRRKPDKASETSWPHLCVGGAA